MKYKLERRLPLFLPLFLVCAAACDDPLLEVQTIQGLRVLGARVEAADDPSGAEPSAGDTAQLKWLVVADQLWDFSSVLHVCRARSGTQGIPECAAKPFFEDERDGTTAADLGFEFILPSDFPKDAEWLARLVVCPQGRPRLNREGVGRCASGGDPVEATYRASLGTTDSNKNPDLSDDVLTLNGTAWLPASQLSAEQAHPGEPCDDTESLLEVRAERTSSIEFTLGGDDRETLPREERERFGVPATETLIYSHFFTLPGLQRPFSVIEAESDSSGFEVELTLDRADVPRRGVVADFYLVVRDGRGGADWTRHKVCVHR